MSFLFAQLPAKNYEMTESQLLVWQRSAIFECECDNLINRTIEAEDRRDRMTIRRFRRRRFNAAIDAAIAAHGLRLGEHNPRTRSLSLPQNPSVRLDDIQDDRNVYNAMLDHAFSAAAHNIGLNLPNIDHHP